MHVTLLALNCRPAEYVHSSLENSSQMEPFTNSPAEWMVCAAQVEQLCLHAWPQGKLYPHTSVHLVGSTCIERSSLYSGGVDEPVTNMCHSSRVPSFNSGFKHNTETSFLATFKGLLQTDLDFCNLPTLSLDGVATVFQMDLHFVGAHNTLCFLCPAHMNLKLWNFRQLC